MQKDDSSVVVYSIDSDYIWSFLISMYSANYHAVKTISFKLALSVGSCKPHEIQLIENFALHFKIDLEILTLPNFPELNILNHVSKTAYNKFLIPQFLNCNYLWMDSDTLCCRGWDNVFAAGNFNENFVNARFEPLIFENTKNKNQAKNVSGDRYFNSGVMLINPIQFRRNSVLLNWHNVAIRGRELGFELNDQDVWNYLLCGEVDELPVKFNYFADGRDSSEEALIIHFLGKRKPWHFSKYQRFFMHLSDIFGKKSSLNNGLLDYINMDWYIKYWRIEEELLALLVSTNSELRSSLIVIRSQSVKNHFDLKFEFKVFVTYKLINFLMKDFF